MKKLFTSKTLYIGLAILTALIVLFIYIAINKKNSASVTVVDNSSKIDFAEPIFDGSSRIGETNIVVGYPTKGFFGLGVKIDEVKEGPYIFGVKTIDTSAKFDPKISGGFVGFSVSVEKRKDNQSLANIISSTPKEMPYYKREMLGKIITVNNKEYYIYDSSETFGDDRGKGWVAITIEKNMLITIGFGGHISTTNFPNPTPETLAAVKQYDKLFMQILEHIKYN